MIVNAGKRIPMSAARDRGYRWTRSHLLLQLAHICLTRLKSLDERYIMIERRTLLKSAGVAALSTAGVGALASCTDSPTTQNQSTTKGVRLPNYVPYTKVQPDLPGTNEGVLPAYLSYPKDLVDLTAEPPFKGGEVTAFTYLFGAPPPSVDRNKYWQELNKRIGADFKLNTVLVEDFPNKFSTIIAGGDIPDLMSISPTQRDIPALLKSKFQNLSEFLAGDAISDYPALANIPTESWRATAFNGGIYGLPIPRSNVGTIVFVRKDKVTEKGLKLQPENFEEFRELCKGLTDTKKNQWAMATPDQMMIYMLEMAKFPNLWKQENGKFTFWAESEEAKQALSDMVTLVKDGVFHPDSFSASIAQATTWLHGGTISIQRTGYPGWSDWAKYPNPTSLIDAIVAPGHDGGAGTHRAGPPTLHVTAIKKASAARVKEILRLANWLAAPLGTKEALFRSYGIEGVDFEFKNGNPTKTSTGDVELKLPVSYIAAAPAILYTPQSTDLTKAQHEFQTRLVADIVPDPTVGLFSNTNAGQGAQLSKILTDAQSDIFQGRKPLSAWDDIVKQWRSTGGDTARSEYEAAFEEANG